MSDQGSGEKVGIRFSKEISLGHIVMLIGIMGSGISIYTATMVRMGSQDARVVALERIAVTQQDFNKTIIELLNEVRSNVAVLKDRSERDKPR